MLKATRLLNQKTFENPNLEDSEGKLATRQEVSKLWKAIKMLYHSKKQQND